MEGLRKTASSGVAARQGLSTPNAGLSAEPASRVLWFDQLALFPGTQNFVEGALCFFITTNAAIGTSPPYGRTLEYGSDQRLVDYFASGLN